MKTVVIKGKHNEDKINNIDNPIRNEATKYKFDIANYDHKKQINVLNNLYLGNKINNEKDISILKSFKASNIIPAPGFLVFSSERYLPLPIVG